eukprot:CAMPEP_0168350910 /NCGR_PEP_ID=MMETSP0213-20121227/21468_1 /TAXON_ID=151035 /ORGANISM="Euplotes harpa, Strain FSP1.4" /LENGTH=48 /DNA_ID= /DNA_START= /DNA_END= /DNA_ORIENTATION=
MVEYAALRAQQRVAQLVQAFVLARILNANEWYYDLADLPSLFHSKLAA